MEREAPLEVLGTESKDANGIREWEVLASVIGGTKNVLERLQLQLLVRMVWGSLVELGGISKRDIRVFASVRTSVPASS